MWNNSRKNIVLWVVTPCSSKIGRCFGGTYRLNYQDRRISQTSQSTWRYSPVESSLHVHHVRTSNRTTGREMKPEISCWEAEVKGKTQL
jgi:hypothetical protein